MARREALLRLHQRLVGRRNTLRRTLAGELADLRCNIRGESATGDAADAAFDAGSDEIASQLAQLEARELNLIERALARMKQGAYGVCESCSKKIPVTRLNALPYSSMCIECQQEMERHGHWGDGSEADWDRVHETESRYDEGRVNLSDLEVDVSGAGR